MSQNIRSRRRREERRHFDPTAAGVFRKEPSAQQICALLDHAAERAGRAPRYIVSDQGAQFQGQYRAWCEQRGGVTPRFGAIGQHGSIAVIERFMRSMKHECFRKSVVPLSLRAMMRELSLYCFWYNEFRPHAALAGATPAEIRDGRLPARDQPPLEVRRCLPRTRDDPSRLVKRDPNPLELSVSYLEGRKHLPVIELKRAA